MVAVLVVFGIAFVILLFARRVAAYATGIGIISLVGAELLILSANQGDEDNLTLLAIGVILLYFGVGCRLSYARRKHELEQKAEWEKSWAQDAAEREAAEETPAYKLGLFLSDSKDFSKVVRRKRALASGELENISPQAILLIDVISLIRRIALPKDEVRTSDARQLRFFCQALYSNDAIRFDEDKAADRFIKILGDEIDWYEQEVPFDSTIIEDIEDRDTQEQWGLTLLVEAQSDEAAELRDRLLAFAIDIGLAHNREEALRETITHIKNSATTESQRVEYVDDIGDARYEVLGVSRFCTTEELRAAYHQKVALWHPDKLQNMAPELQAMATEQLAKLNAAYQGICEQRERTG